MTVPNSRTNWIIRIGCFLSGLGFVALAPYLWRTAYEIGLPVTPGPSRLWQITAIIALAIGALLLFAGAEYRNPWRRLRRFMNTDNVTIALMAGLMLALGSFTYFVLNERLAKSCWRGPFEWTMVVSCPFYAILTIVAWVVTAALVVLVYFGAVHHPILRALGGSQRGLLADDTDDEYI